MEFPDYHGGGILNLMSSLVIGMGGAPTGYAECDLLGSERIGRARHLVLLVVDGLGRDYLNAAGVGGHLHAHLLGALSSAAPPTTAAAIPLFLTAVPPGRHGFTGWYTWLRELGCVTAVLPFVTRHGRLALDRAGPGPMQLSGCMPVFWRLPVDCHVVSPRRIAYSAFNQAFSGGARIHAYDGLGGFFRTLRAALKPGRGRSLVYAYWSELDALAHEHGIGSARVAQHLAEFDSAFGRFLQRIRGNDTAVLVIADHGFIDSPPERQLQLADHPDLQACLTLPLCGEPRCAYCYVKPDYCAAFESYVHSELGRQVWMHPSGDLIEQGVFGPGPLHPELAHRVGDYVLVLRDDYTLKDRLPGERTFRQIGVHGGLSPDELYVPLVYAEV